MGRGCGKVGRAVVSNAWGSQSEYSQQYCYLLPINCKPTGLIAMPTTIIAKLTATIVKPTSMIAISIVMIAKSRVTIAIPNYS